MELRYYVVAAQSLLTLMAIGLSTLLALSVQAQTPSLTVSSSDPRPPRQQSASDTVKLPTSPLQPVYLTILEPKAGNAVSPQEADFNRTASIVVRLGYDWPDGQPRSIQRVEYWLGGQRSVQNDAPYDTFDLPVRNLPSGPYVLSVAATDEFGLRSNLTDIAFELEQPHIPLTPPFEQAMPSTSALDAEFTEAVTPLTGIVQPVLRDYRQLSTILVITLLAFAPMIILAEVVTIRRSRYRQKLREGIFGEGTELPNDSTAFESKPTMVEQTAYELTEDATEPQVMVNFVSPASLVYVDGGDHLPPKLDIEGGREVRIGRKQAYCDVIIDDQRVSRLHASIVEKEDGKFYIKDEGSSGGTYVNRRKLRANDMAELHHNDTINFNTVAYRFELNDQSAQAGKP